LIKLPTFWEVSDCKAEMSTDGTEGPLLRAQSEQTTINMGPRGG